HGPGRTIVHRHRAADAPRRAVEAGELARDGRKGGTGAVRRRDDGAGLERAGPRHGSLPLAALVPVDGPGAPRADLVERQALDGSDVPAEPEDEAVGDGGDASGSRKKSRTASLT